MTPDEYIGLVYKNLKGEITETEFELLTDLTVSDAQLADVRLEVETLWDASGQVPTVVTKQETETLYRSLTGQGTKTNNSRKSGKLLTLRRVLSGVAALLLIAFGTRYLMLDQTVIYQEAGQYTLADGSVVDLRAGSTLTVPPFSKTDRTVELSGEAYFDVEKVTGKSFTVATRDVQVTVLGTQFLIKEQPATTFIQLYEGSVRSTDKRSEQTAILAPGMSAIHGNAGAIEILVDLPSIDAWRLGSYEYSNTPLAAAVRQLELIHDVSIRIASKEMDNCELSGLINGSTAEEVLTKIAKRYSMKVTSTGDTYVLNGGSCG